MSDERKSVEDATPMEPLDPDHDGDADAPADPGDVDDVGVAPDLADPLKRTDDDDMPGLDPTPPVIPSD